MSDEIRQDNLRTVVLAEGWTLTGTAPGSCAEPGGLESISSRWHDARVPGTVAQALHSDIDAHGNYDSDDWWYRCKFGLTDPDSTCFRLCFEGLATLAKVWLNGSLILSSRNMFVSGTVDVSDLLSADNELVILFESLSAALAHRRPRPRWKTALVDNQNLRWFRTTLLGRIPGWTPPITAVGPWRPITLHCSQQFELTSMDLQTRASGTTGMLLISAEIRLLFRHSLEKARMRIADGTYELEIIRDAGKAIVRGDVHIPEVERWWPHTHGEPRLYECVLELQMDDSWFAVNCGSVGFKHLTVDRRRGVEFVINEVPVFCRGACWTIGEFISLGADGKMLRQTLTAARDAGLNMLRIGGTMVYESGEFYRLCDELGILVWQDFMFANMDYPVDDADFRTEIEREARHQLGRLQRHVCIAAYCGGSEIAQQAAMLGRPAADWANPFLLETLPQYCAGLHPSIPYFPSSPWGGALPFHVATGISHYYGVGAYRRPLSDVKHAAVKFTTECLGFSNVPDRETIALMHDGMMLPPHHPRWKARQPRDSGAGWDFEDVRDHYFRELFGLDPIEVRSVDVERYYAMSRVVTGEVMQAVFNEWRRPDNACSGGLVWFFQDLWPGAGWGIVDSTGRPKAAFWYLKRAWATRTVRFIDEGLNGLNVVVLNECAEPLEARVEVALYQHGHRVAATAQSSVDVAARAALTLQVDAMLGYFTDSNAAYRFGPPKYDVVGVFLYERKTGDLLGNDFYFPTGLNLPIQDDAGLTAEVAWANEGQPLLVTLRSAHFLQSVSVSCKHFTPSNNYFHMAPGRETRLAFSPSDGDRTSFKADFEALNMSGVVSVRAHRQ